MAFKSGNEWNGNKNGRPKKFTIKDYITNKEVKELVTVAKKNAKEGKTDILKFLLEQVFGKAPQSLDLTTGGEKIYNWAEYGKNNSILPASLDKRISRKSKKMESSGNT